MSTEPVNPDKDLAAEEPIVGYSELTPSADDPTEDLEVEAVEELAPVIGVSKLAPSSNEPDSPVDDAAAPPPSEDDGEVEELEPVTGVSQLPTNEHEPEPSSSGSEAPATIPDQNESPVAEASTVSDSTTARTQSDGHDHAAQTHQTVEHAPNDLIANRYLIVREIGRGGMGLVYLAQDQKLNRYVSIKRLILQAGNRSTVQRRFLREAQTIASLGHIHIVNIHDIGQDEHGYYITMEYVSGPNIGLDPPDTKPASPVTLQQYIKTKGPMALEMAREIAVKLCSALDYAHHQDIIHRDVKPSNVLLDERFEPKLVDFGLARPLGRKDEEITLEGQSMGTPEYVAPEQWSDATEADSRADIFALGAVLWFMISGQIPRYLRESEVPEELRAALLKAMAHKRGDRFDTAKDLMEALNASDADEAVTAVGADGEEVSIVGKWKCPNCSKYSPDSARYCIGCGTFGMESCPVCETEIRIGTPYCPDCGADVRDAEESHSILNTAKNEAGMLEYESALNSIKALDNRNNEEAARLAKEWRQIVLNRRNLLTELESCLAVFNMDRAVDIHKELNGIVPSECLSESADFDVVVKFSTLDADLKGKLKESAHRAHDDYNLDQFSRNIENLNEVCGIDACNTINTELTGISNELNQIVTKAGLAIGMNCLSKGLDVLESAMPWKGSELGERRNRMLDHCKELIKEREQYIDNLEEAIQKNNYSEALAFLSHTTQFRLPPNNSEMEPEADDLAAHDRIVNIDKVLSQKFASKIPEWLANDNWKDLKNGLAAMKGSGDPTWKRINEDLRSKVNKKIAEIYNKALIVEGRGKLAQAQKLWDGFLTIPRELAQSQLYQYATEYPRRKQGHIHAKRHALIRRSIILCCILWGVSPFLYGISRLVTGRPLMTIAPAEILVPAVINIAVFMALVLAITRKKIIHREMRRDFSLSPLRLQLLSALLACSPISYVFYKCFTFVLLIGPGLSVTIFLLLIGLFWLVVDLLRTQEFRMPGSISLAVSWLVLIGLSLLTGGFGLHGHQLWPALATMHAILFGVLAVVDNLMGKGQAVSNEPVAKPAVADPVT